MRVVVGRRALRLLLSDALRVSRIQQEVHEVPDRLEHFRWYPARLPQDQLNEILRPIVQECFLRRNGDDPFVFMEFLWSRFAHLRNLTPELQESPPIRGGKASRVDVLDLSKVDCARGTPPK